MSESRFETTEYTVYAIDDGGIRGTTPAENARDGEFGIGFGFKVFAVLRNAVSIVIYRYAKFNVDIQMCLTHVS